MTREDWIVLIIGAILGGVILIAAGAMVHAAPIQCGMASFYGAESGRITASGERFDPRAMTAASRSLPFGTIVTVTVLKTGRSLPVRITDRGPAAWTRRIIDLSRAAAEALGITRQGVATVCLSETRPQ